MLSLVIAFFASFVTTLLIIKFDKYHSHLTHDHDLLGPQKFHKLPVPRIGGLSIAIGVILATLVNAINEAPKLDILQIILYAVIPCFTIGSIEDFTKNISIKVRLFFTATSSALLIYFTQTSITRIDIPGLDAALAIPIISILFTCFAITGLANAYNIIDGFNGLSSMVGMMSLIAIAYVSFIVGDPVLAGIAFIMVGAIGGFFIWNYPKGLIFLGDGGSYIIGFWNAALCILLISRHQNVSPWFALLVNGYPIFETLFTIYRRRIHQGKKVGDPDAIHFHSLIYRRLLSQISLAKNSADSPDFSNSLTSPFLWVLACVAIIPSMLWWNSTWKLMICAFIFGVVYIQLYKMIVKFQSPKWLKFF